MKKVYDEHVVASIELSETIEVVFYYDHYRDNVWANIRKFVRSKKYTGPTKQGVKFEPSRLPELKKAFETAKNMEATMRDEEFLRFSKSPIRDLVMHACVFKGALGVDIREWLHTDKYTGWTKAGVKFPLDVLQQVIETLDKMLHTKPVLKEISNEDRPTVKDSGANDSTVSDSGIEGVPERLRHLFYKEAENGE